MYLVFDALGARGARGLGLAARLGRDGGFADKTKRSSASARLRSCVR